jgi:hypothetical protein
MISPPSSTVVNLSLLLFTFALWMLFNFNTGILSSNEFTISVLKASMIPFPLIGTALTTTSSSLTSTVWDTSVPSPTSTFTLRPLRHQITASSSSLFRLIRSSSCSRLVRLVVLFRLVDSSSDSSSSCSDSRLVVFRLQTRLLLHLDLNLFIIFLSCLVFSLFILIWILFIIFLVMFRLVVLVFFFSSWSRIFIIFLVIFIRFVVFSTLTESSFVLSFFYFDATIRVDIWDNTHGLHVMTEFSFQI